MPAIVIDRLTKSFRGRAARPTGFRRLPALLRPAPVIRIDAVRDLSFAIEPGERVAFIGPNGAGKSTTLKMLTGILQPSSGHAEIAGFVPWRERRRLALDIGIVFGQRSQLWYHLKVRQSFDLLGRIYAVEPSVYRARLARLAERFAIAICSTGRSRSSPWASACAARSPGRYCTGRSCCCSTSRPSASTSPPRRRCATISTRSRAKTARRSC